MILSPNAYMVSIISSFLGISWNVKLMLLIVSMIWMIYLCAGLTENRFSRGKNGCIVWANQTCFSKILEETIMLDSIYIGYFDVGQFHRDGNLFFKLSLVLHYQVYQIHFDSIWYKYSALASTMRHCTWESHFFILCVTIFASPVEKYNSRCIIIGIRVSMGLAICMKNKAYMPQTELRMAY